MPGDFWEDFRRRMQPSSTGYDAGGYVADIGGGMGWGAPAAPTPLNPWNLKASPGAKKKSSSDDPNAAGAGSGGPDAGPMGGGDAMPGVGDVADLGDIGIAAARGGMVRGYAPGGPVDPNATPDQTIGSGMFGWGPGQTFHQYQFDPSLGKLDQTQGNQARADEQQNLAQLQQDAAGNGPAQAIANAQLQRGTDANIRQQMAMGAAGAGSMGNAAALRSIGENGANAQQQEAGQAASTDANLALQAQGMYGTQAGAMRGQDLGAAGQAMQGGLQAGQLGAQAYQANAGLKNAALTGQANATQNAISGVGQAIVTGGASLAGAAHGGQIGHPDMVPGKAPIPGDHPENDNVPAVLSKGEIVLPNSVTQSDDPVGNAADFVAKTKGGDDDSFGKALAKKGGKSGFMRMVDSHREHSARLDKLEKMLKAMT